MEDFDKQIAEKVQDLVNTKASMEDARNVFKDAVSVFIKTWFENMSKQIIIENPDEAHKLGIDVLKQIKIEVHGLIDKSNDLVDKYFDDESFWWHLKENNNPNHFYSHRLPNDLDGQLKKLAGELGLVFDNHGLAVVNIGHNHDINKRFIKEYNKDIIFSRNIDINENIDTAYKEYDRLLTSAKKTKSVISQLKDKKEKANIGDLWDSL